MVVLAVMGMIVLGIQAYSFGIFMNQGTKVTSLTSPGVSFGLSHHDRTLCLRFYSQFTFIKVLRQGAEEWVKTENGNRVLISFDSLIPEC